MFTLSVKYEGKNGLSKAIVTINMEGEETKHIFMARDTTEWWVIVDRIEDLIECIERDKNNIQERIYQLVRWCQNPTFRSLGKKLLKKTIEYL